jgi:2,3-bisphosphoglycerate-dependent phosphoglycerate mutase
VLRLGPTSLGRNRQGSNTVLLVAIEIVFETHATTEDNERGIATGWLPGRLSPRGRAQAEQLGDRRRPDGGIHTVFTSDLGRAVETAAIAFGSTEIPILADWRLRECDYGERNGTPVEWFVGRRAEHVDVPYPGGESWRAAADRVRRFLDDLPTRWSGERVLVIGHSATRWALDHLLDAKALEEIVDADFAWQEGWEYVVP